MNTQPDFEELLRLLEEHDVRYMIVGGYAVTFHGYARFTKDLDILYRRDRTNVARLRKALAAFGFGRAALPEKLFLEEGSIIKFGVEPVRIDLVNTIAAVEFDAAESRAVEGRYGSVTSRFIGKDDLIRNK